MMSLEELHIGMKVYFVQHKPGTEPYVNSAFITSKEYVCRHPDTGEPLYPATSSYRKLRCYLGWRRFFPLKKKRETQLHR